VDLRQLRYFAAVVDAGSFTEAAAVLHIAQSALSRHVRELEDDVGGQLLDRHARGVTPTETGQVLLRTARFILAQIEDTKAELQALHGEVRGAVRFGVPSSLSQVLYVPLVNYFLDRYPHVLLTLSEATSHGVLVQLREGTLDLGVVTQPPPDRHMQYEPLMEENLVLMGPVGDPLMRRRSLDPDVLQRVPIIIAAGVLRILGSQATGFKPRVLVDSTIPIKSLVLAGRGYAVAPASSNLVDTHEGRIVSVPIKGLHLQRVIATHRGRPVSRATQAMIAYLRQEASAILKTKPRNASPAPSGKA